MHNDSNLIQTPSDKFEDLFKLRTQIIWPKPTLAAVYGAILRIASRYSREATKEGFIFYASMRDITFLTGLGHKIGDISKLVKQLEALGLIKILEMNNSAKASRLLLYFSQITLSKISRDLPRITLSPGNQVHPQTTLSQSNKVLPQNTLKDNLIDNSKESNSNYILNLIVRKKSNVLKYDIYKDNYYYTSIYEILWGQFEGKLRSKRGILGYQKGLSPYQKWALELICTYELTVDHLSTVLGIRKDNTSRILKGLRYYVRLEDGLVNPRSNLNITLSENYDWFRHHKMEKQTKDSRSIYKLNQREYNYKKDFSALEHWMNSKVYA